MPRISSLLSRALLILAIAACRTSSADVSPAQRIAITKEIETRVRSAYDLSVPNAEQRMLALYADTGRIVSASGGQVIASRDTLAKGIELFWRNVGVNMRQPKWIWTHMYVDVLSPESAVFTGTYRVPHMTPRGEPHEIAGAMTLVFEKRGGTWGVVQEHLSDLPAAEMQMDTSMKTKGATPQPRK
jgi:ketosteroid isomerase-like protein